jgi:hypothetical protein
MLTPMPDALDLSKALILKVENGRIAIDALNVPLSARTVRGA